MHALKRQTEHHSYPALPAAFFHGNARNDQRPDAYLKDDFPETIGDAHRRDSIKISPLPINIGFWAMVRQYGELRETSYLNPDERLGYLIRPKIILGMRGISQPVIEIDQFQTDSGINPCFREIDPVRSEYRYSQRAEKRRY